MNHFPSTLTATPGSSPGEFTLTLKGEPSTSYIVEASVDFANWAPFSTNVTAATGLITNEVSTAGSDFKFYRAVSGP